MTKGFPELLGVALLSWLAAGCTHTRFSQYTGSKDTVWPESNGTMADTAFSIPVYRGWPERPYVVLGSVRFDEPRKFWDDGIIRMVAARAKSHKGEAIIIRQGTEFGVGKIIGAPGYSSFVSENQTTALVIRWLTVEELQKRNQQHREFIQLYRREYPNVRANEEVEEILIKHLLREGKTDAYAEGMAKQLASEMERINKGGGDDLSGVWVFKGTLGTSSVTSQGDEETLLGLATVKADGESIAIVSNAGRIEINFNGSHTKGRVQGQIGIGSFSSKCEGAALGGKISLSFHSPTPDGTVRGNLVFQR